MLRLFLLFVILFNDSSTLFTSKHYEIIKLRDAKIPKNQLTWDEASKKSIRNLYKGRLPEDDEESENWGDLEFINTDKQGDLITRDTVINDYYEDDILIKYERSFPGFYIKDVKVLNFGRQRGYCHRAIIWHGKAKVEAEIIVLKGRMVRMSVEVYGKKI